MPEAATKSRPAHRRLSPGTIARTVIHAAVALAVVASLLRLGRVTTIAWVASLALLALGAEILRARAGWFDALVRRCFGAMMKPGEKQLTRGRICFNGATWSLLAAFATVLLFPTSIAVTALAVLAIADPAAGLVGRTIGRIRMLKGRTLEGSLVFFLVALLVIALTSPLPLELCLLVALGATAAEAIEIPPNDNVRVPLVTGLLLVVL